VQPLLPDISASATLLGKSGRPLKFTPERIEQIRNLVERGMSREQIAEMLDVTLGSLQVTCSRLGLSLRRPRLQNGVKQTGTSQPKLVALMPPARNGNAVEPTNGAKLTNGANASLAVVFSYRGQQRVTEIPVTAEDLMHFMFTSVFKEQSFGKLIAEFMRQEIESERR
jgi:hypothetical protein